MLGARYYGIYLIKTSSGIVNSCHQREHNSDWLLIMRLWFGLIADLRPPITTTFDPSEVSLDGIITINFIL